MPVPRSAPDPAEPAGEPDGSELTEKLSRMSIERPFDSSEYLDGPRYQAEGRVSPWGDDPMAPAPKHKPKAKPVDG